MNLKILQLGAGSMGSRRLRDLTDREDVELSLYDISPERRDNAEKRFGVRTFESFEEALDANPAAFIISTPPDTHMEYVKAAIVRRINFFCEADIWNNNYTGIKKAGEDHKIICAPSSSLKLLPIVRELKRIVNEELGTLHAYGMNLSIDLPSWHPNEGPEYYARKRETSGGREMVTFEMGYLNHIFGKPSTVTGTVRKDGELCEDTWCLQMALEDGGTGQFSIIAKCPERNRKGWAAGSNGIVRFDIQAGELEYKLSGDDSFSCRKFGGLGDILEGVYKEEISLFIDAVLGKKEYYFSYDENAVCTAALAAAERSAFFGTVEKVDIQKQPALYPDSYLAGQLENLIDNKKDVTLSLYEYSKQRIPGGTQLLSKRPEMFAPGVWPAYFSRAQGCETWDLDGNHYYDMSYNGIGACLLGFNDPDVTSSVQRRIGAGSMCTLNPPEEVLLADRLCEIHPWAQQARFTRGGGESAAVAVRIARATTGKSLIAVCGYHGWHDWYLAANLGEKDSLDGHLLPGLDPAGVPRELRGTVYTFRYNAIDEFKNIMDKYGDKIAAVIMEPCRHSYPEPGFVEYVRKESKQYGAILIFDEITIGWRLHYGGSHLKLGVDPDMAIFAKALGNGFPIGAVIGTREAMEGAHNSFISSTNWTESIGPTAALATLDKMSKVDVPSHVGKIGETVMGYWKTYGDKYGLPIKTGEDFGCLAKFTFDHKLSNELKTLYIQKMLEKGFLAGIMIYPTMAHNDDVISKYAAAIDEVFHEISKGLERGNIKDMMKGPAAHVGFRRLV